MTQKLWMVRAGGHGEQEAIALERGLITIGWNKLPNLSRFKSREELKAEYDKHYKEDNVYSEGLKVGQIFRFAHRIEKGDVVVLPSKFSPDIHIGEVTGNYSYHEKEEEVKHCVPVKWHRTVPRAQFEEDLLYSFGSLLTVSNIKRNNALERVKALMHGKKIDAPVIEEELEAGDDIVQNAQMEELAYTRIEQFIQNRFKDYELEDLVREVMKAHGYTTSHPREIGGLEGKSRKGEDGGADILASNGPLGFEEPRIVIQVKSSEDKVQPKVLRELMGVMNTFGAQYGILVSWSGFTDTLKKEARSNYFKVRLWSSEDIIREVFAHYDRFSDEMKLKLPMKRVWILEE